MKPKAFCIAPRPFAALLLVGFAALALPASWVADARAADAPAPRPPSAADLRPNNPAVPDAYALTGQFDRVVVMRMKFKTDLLVGIEQMAKQQGIRNGVILSGIGSVRGYNIHQVAARDFPSLDSQESAPDTPADIVGMNGYIVRGAVHAHITLASKDRTVGGHLDPGTQVFTFAIVTVGVMNETDLGRVDDETNR